MFVCSQNKLQNSLINSWCAELCKTVSALRSCWVRETIDEHKDEEKPTTSVKAKSKSVVTLKEKPRKVSSTGSNDLFVDFLPPNLKNVPKSAWAGIVSSHLATGGASLVVGKDNVAVNQLIRFLLCFASAREEGYCSRYSLPTLPDTFMKGLLVQVSPFYFHNIRPVFFALNVRRSKIHFFPRDLLLGE